MLKHVKNLQGKRRRKTQFFVPSAALVVHHSLMGRTVLLLFAAAALVARAQVKLPDTSDLTTTVIKAGVYVPFSNIDGSLREWGKWRDVALAIAVAADDFNARDPRVVAAFDTPCNLTMDLVFIDSFSSTVSVANARSFLSYAATKGGPAIDLNIGGATTDESAMLGVLAGIDSQLLVAHGGSTASKLSGSDYPTLVRTVTSSVEPRGASAPCSTRSTGATARTRRPSSRASTSPASRSSPSTRTTRS